MMGRAERLALGASEGPRQKAILEPPIDRRLDGGDGDLGRIAEQATSVLDDRRVAELVENSRLHIQSPDHQQMKGALLGGEMSLGSFDGRGGDTAYPSLSPPVAARVLSRPLSPDQPER